MRTLGTSCFTYKLYLLSPKHSLLKESIDHYSFHDEIDFSCFCFFFSLKFYYIARTEHRYEGTWNEWDHDAWWERHRE